MLGFWMSVLEQGLIYGVMVLGVYITYRILDLADMTVDGSFPLGAAVTATALMSGVNPYAACILSLLAGLLAGSVTGFLHTKLKISSLLSGILMMTALYSINLRIMGKANVPLFNKATIFSGGLSPIVVIIVFALIVKVLLDIFLGTKLGFLLKATGDNPGLVTSLGIDTGIIKILGLAIANGFVALSGSIMAQYQRFSDVGMGTGVIVMGLASIIFGEAIFGRLGFIKSTAIVLLGAFLYKTCTAFALRSGLPPTDLKLITSVIVVAALAVNKKGLNFKFKKQSGERGKSNVKYKEIA